MKTVGQIGRIIYGLPFIVFGSFHFMQAQSMAESMLSGWPFAEFLVYLTGVALILAGISVVFRIMDKLAMLLLGILLFIFVIAIHIPGIIGAADQQAMQQSMTSLLKDLSLGGAAWFMAAQFSKEKQPSDTSEQ